jgi:hypothetical protein
MHSAVLRRRHPEIFPSKNSVLDPDPDANFKMATVRVADPHHFIVDLIFHLNAYADPDPSPNQSDANLRQLVYRLSRQCCGTGTGTLGTVTFCLVEPEP